MIRVLLIVLFFFDFFNICYGQVQTKIVLKIDNKIVTNFEVKNKILIELLLSNLEINQKNIDNFKAQAVSSLIDLKLKEIELEKFTANFKNTDINNYLKLITKKNVNELKSIFFKNDLDFNLFLDEVKTELKWRQFIYNTYSSRLDINIDNIDKELETFLKTESLKVEFKLSEIELLLENVDNYQTKVLEIKKIIEDIGFENAALKFSTSGTKLNSGDLGWIRSNSLSKEIYNNLKNLKKGDISKPIIKGNTLTLFKLVDKREINSNDIDKDIVRKNLIELKKVELFGLYSNSHLSKLKNTSLIEYK